MRTARRPATPTTRPPPGRPGGGGAPAEGGVGRGDRRGRCRPVGEASASVAEQPPVLLHRRSAPRRVDNDRVHAGRLERGDRLLGEPDGLLRATGVQRQRAAAPLPARNDHVASLGRQHPRGGGVDPREEHRLHAAGQHADHRAPVPSAGTRSGKRPAGKPGKRARAAGRPRRRGRPALAVRPRVSAAVPARWASAQRGGQRPQPAGYGNTAKIAARVADRGTTGEQARPPRPPRRPPGHPPRQAPGATAQPRPPRSTPGPPR